MRYLILVVLLCGCGGSTPQPPSAEQQRLLDLMLTSQSTTESIQSEVKDQTQLLVDIKTLIETRPAGAVVPPEPPSTPSQAMPPTAPAFSKPVLYVSYTRFCAPCNRLKKDIKSGKFSEFEVREADIEGWTQGYPVIRFKVGDEWKYLVNPATKQNRGYDSNSLRDIKTMLGMQ